MNVRFRGCVRIVGYLAAAVAFTAGCRALPPGTVQHPAELRDGQLVICQLEYGPERRHEVRAQLAAHDYAILIHWPNDTCAPRFFVYDRPHRHVDEACSFETFLALVDRLPHGVPVA